MVSGKANKGPRELLQAAQRAGLRIEITLLDGSDPLYNGTDASKAWEICDAFDAQDEITIILYKDDIEVGRAACAPHLLLGRLTKASGQWVKNWLGE